jgi:hypothetical protein
MANHHVLLAGRPGWHGSARQKAKESDVTGTPYLRKELPLVERLPDEVCGCDKAGNHRLHGDQSSPLFLQELFNPVVVSLRSLQPASEEALRVQIAK